MNVYADKTQKNKNQSISTAGSQVQHRSKPTFQFVDNRPGVINKREDNQSDWLAGKQIRQVKEQASVVQGAFTAQGEKIKKIRQWVGRTKEKLRNNNEKLLLRVFVYLHKSTTNFEWDIREDYALTKHKLRERVNDMPNAPALTVLDEDYPIRGLRGERSTTGYKRLEAWDLKDRGELNPDTHTELAHVSTSTEWMSERLDPYHGAETGELGAGFYTVSGHDQAPSKAIRDEFGKTGNVPRDVLSIRIENNELRLLVNNDAALGDFLIYVLQHASGYPADSNPIASINAINKIGKVLIFPDKTTKVDIDTNGTKHSYDTYREANGGPGNHSIIIGPQARPSLDGIRQICARGYLGDTILNEGVRSKSKLGPRNT